MLSQFLTRLKKLYYPHKKVIHVIVAFFILVLFGNSSQETDFKINVLQAFKITKNYVKRRMFLGNALTREAGLILLTTNGIILLCVSSILITFQDVISLSPYMAIILKISTQRLQIEWV